MITASGFSASTRARVAFVRVRISAPPNCTSRVRLVMMPPNSARVGQHLVQASAWPPSRSPASHRVTSWPRSDADGGGLHAGRAAAGDQDLLLLAAAACACRRSVRGRSRDAGCRRSDSPDGNGRCRPGCSAMQARMSSSLPASALPRHVGIADHGAGHADHVGRALGDGSSRPPAAG